MLVGSVSIRVWTWYFHGVFAEALSLNICLELCGFYSDSISYSELRIILRCLPNYHCQDVQSQERVGTSGVQ